MGQLPKKKEESSIPHWWGHFPCVPCSRWRCPGRGWTGWIPEVPPKPSYPGIPWVPGRDREEHPAPNSATAAQPSFKSSSAGAPGNSWMGSWAKKPWKCFQQLLNPTISGVGKALWGHGVQAVTDPKFVTSPGLPWPPPAMGTPQGKAKAEGEMG